MSDWNDEELAEGTLDSWELDICYGPSSGNEWDLVQDSGFEDGSSGFHWNDVSALFEEGNIVQNWWLSHEGEWLAYFAGGDYYGGAETASVSQTGIISEGESVMLTSWLRIKSNDTDGTFRVMVDDQTVFETTAADEKYSSGAWTAVKVDLSDFADGNSHDLKIVADISAGGGRTEFLVDDVSLSVEFGEDISLGNFIAILRIMAGKSVTVTVHDVTDDGKANLEDVNWILQQLSGAD